MRLTNDAVLLGFETQRVIGLRLVKLSRGGLAAELEALRMVTEKTAALAEAGMKFDQFSRGLIDAVTAR